MSSKPDIERKRAEAKERTEYYQSLTPTERLAMIDRRLGKGKGAMRERARLQALIDAEQVKKAQPRS